MQMPQINGEESPPFLEQSNVTIPRNNESKKIMNVQEHLMSKVH